MQGWIEDAIVGDGEVDAASGFYKSKIAGMIREFFDRLELLVVEWRLGGKWSPTPIRISLPAEENARSTLVAEDGAQLVLDRAYAFSSEIESKKGRHPTLRFAGFGSSRSGDTVKEICSLQFSFLDDDSDTDEEKRRKGDERSELLQGYELQGKFAKDLHGYWQDAQKHIATLLDKNIEMAEKVSLNAGVLVEGMKLDHKIAKKRLKRDAEVADAKARAEMFGKFWDDSGDMIGEIAMMWASSKMDIDPEKMKGSPPRRLKKIYDGMTGEQKEKLTEILGEDAHVLIKAAIKSEDEQEFRELLKRFTALFGEGKDAQAKMIQLSQSIGKENTIALMKLLKDAGVAE